MRSIIPIVLTLTSLTATTAHSAPCGPFTGYQCPPMAVGSPQDAREDRERVERAEAALEEIRAARRSYETAPSEDANVRHAREINAQRRSRAAYERDRRDAEWNGFVEDSHRSYEAGRLRRAVEERSAPRRFTVTDERGRTFWGTVDLY